MRLRRCCGVANPVHRFGDIIHTSDRELQIYQYRAALSHSLGGHWNGGLSAKWHSGALGAGSRFRRIEPSALIVSCWCSATKVRNVIDIPLRVWL